LSPGSGEALPGCYSVVGGHCSVVIAVPAEATAGGTY
jgi:hypothetical protein